MGVASVCLGLVLLFPMWRIELDAPQYPEGLVLQIFPGKLGGDVEIINGLNHYIGMKTLHAEDFIEFTILPYLVGFFVLASLFVFVLNKTKLLNILFFLFVTFGIVAMVDFWRWEYNYGHDLDPNAAIQIPGMAYQPPLIGFKQLLNFGAFSIPDIGGWLFIVAGTLLLVAFVFEARFKKVDRLKNRVIVLPILFLFFTSVGCNDGPQPIRLGKDHCDFCKMTIADPRYGAEILTNKGKVLKFDDISCTVNYLKKESVTAENPYSVYITDYMQPDKLIEVHNAFFLKSAELRSPMNGNIAAFSSKEKRKEFSKDTSAEELNWDELMKK